jgi:hypothetical protein
MIPAKTIDEALNLSYEIIGKSPKIYVVPQGNFTIAEVN